MPENNNKETPPNDRTELIDEVRELLVDFVLPALILLLCFILIETGKDGEVKSIMTLAVGWIFKSGYARRKSNKNGG